MHRLTRFAIATAAAAAVFATTLAPSQSRGAAALDFWSWDGTVRGEGGGPSRERIVVTVPSEDTSQNQDQDSSQTNDGSRRENGARGRNRDR
jgi:hypothetical protein